MTSSPHPKTTTEHSSAWSALLRKADELVQREALFEQGDRVLVGVSGGVDSVVLWEVMCAQADVWGLGEVAALYVDHGLRGETDQEAAWVRALARAHGRSAFVRKLGLSKEGASLQARAREARRACFLALAEEEGFSRIALAHHRDDQAETLLLRLLRGTGPSGMAGIWPRRDRWVRPLLTCSRQQIEDVAHEQKWSWCEDPTNQQTIYLRNRLRHQTLPLLAMAYNPRLHEHLAHLARRVQQDEALLSSLLERHWRAPLLSQEGPFWRLSLSAWGALPPALRWRVLARLCREAFAQSLPEEHLQQLSLMAQEHKGSAQASLPHGLCAYRVRESLWMFREECLPTCPVSASSALQLVAVSSEASEEKAGSVDVCEVEVLPQWSGDASERPAGQPVSLAPWHLGEPCRIETWWGVMWCGLIFSNEDRNKWRSWASTHTKAPEQAVAVPLQGEAVAVPLQGGVTFAAPSWRACFSSGSLRAGLVIRPRQEGDVLLTPHGHRKLKRWWNDQKIPAFLRGSLPLFADDTRVLWCPGFSSFAPAPSEAASWCVGCVWEPTSWLVRLQRLFFLPESGHPAHV